MLTNRNDILQHLRAGKQIIMGGDGPTAVGSRQIRALIREGLIKLKRKGGRAYVAGPSLEKQG